MIDNLCARGDWLQPSFKLAGRMNQHNTRILTNAELLRQRSSRIPGRDSRVHQGKYRLIEIAPPLIGWQGWSSRETTYFTASFKHSSSTSIAISACSLLV